MTGILTNSQKKVWTFTFDASDPTVNYLAGMYSTQCLVKNKSIISYAAIKFTQFNVTFIGSLELSVIANLIPSVFIYDLSFDGTNNPILNQWIIATNFIGAPTVSTLLSCIDPNNSFLNVSIQTGGGFPTPPTATINQLAFEFYIETTECDA